MLRKLKGKNVVSDTDVMTAEARKERFRMDYRGRNIKLTEKEMEFYKNALRKTIRSISAYTGSLQEVAVWKRFI